MGNIERGDQMRFESLKMDAMSDFTKLKDDEVQELFGHFQSKEKRKEIVDAIFEQTGLFPGAVLEESGRRETVIDEPIRVDNGTYMWRNEDSGGVRRPDNILTFLSRVKDGRIKIVNPRPKSVSR